MLSVYGTHPILIWGMEFYRVEAPGQTIAEKNRAASRKAMAALNERRKAALLQPDYKEPLTRGRGRPRKSSSPTHDDQN